jgi:pyruvate dehydrogenase E1 component alpha subunit
MKNTAESMRKARDEKLNGEAHAALPIAQEAPDFEALYPVRGVLDENGEARREVGLDGDALRKIMELMIWNRELDERLTKLQRQGRIGFHIGSIGEEALMIGSAAALRTTDWVVPCYREMGVALYRGMPLDSIVANMFGTADDPVKGRQMPCHYVDQPHNFLSISSPVGTQITQAAGLGWAMRIRKSSDACAVYFGDGATSEGDFHTGMNFAAVYQAATVFLCRNNQWAISTPYEVQTAAKTIAQKAIAYGMLGERVDGNDALAVYEATKEALDRARSGQGPTLLELLSYRVGAHSTSDDPRAYRDQSEVEPWAKRDPIERFRQHLQKKKLWDDKEDERIKAQITERLQAAIERAEKTAPPSISTLFSDVFVDRPWHLKEEQADLESTLSAGYVPQKGH